MMRSEDHVQQIANYFKKNLVKGYTLESLTFSLSNQGYSRISINKALELANQQLAESAPILKEKPQITYRAIPNGENYAENENFFKRFIKKIFRF